MIDANAVTAVVVTYNRLALLQQCLAALCAHRDRDRSLGMVNSQVLYYPALSVRDTDGL